MQSYRGASACPCAQGCTYRASVAIVVEGREEGDVHVTGLRGASWFR